MKHLYIFLLAFFFSSLAALGTFPYGYHFAGLFFNSSTFFYFVFGVFLSACAGIANAILGAYSLTALERKKNIFQQILLVFFAFLSATLFGFIFYFGYKNILPLYINLTGSLIVVLVNSAICYTAINNLLKSLSKLFMSLRQLAYSEMAIRVIATIIGGIVSLLAFLAAFKGVMEIFKFYQLDWSVAYRWSLTLSIIAWLPFAALFSNSTQIVGGELYHFFQNFYQKFKAIKLSDILLIIFVLASGSAFAQMALEFYDPSSDMPDFFRSSQVQAIIFPILLPLTFLSSAAVNYFALKNVLRSFENKA